MRNDRSVTETQDLAAATADAVTDTAIDDALTEAAVNDVELPEDRYLNRELSWLDFNDRVLALAANPALPLLERRA